LGSRATAGISGRESGGTGRLDQHSDDADYAQPFSAELRGDFGDDSARYTWGA